MRIEDYEGFEKKPESEWTARERFLFEKQGVVPLTEKGRKDYEEHLANSPKMKEASRFIHELAERVRAREGRTETPRQDGDGEEGEP